MKKNSINTSLLKDAGNAMKVQQHQLMSAEEQMLQMKEASTKLADINGENLDQLDMLLEQAESLCCKQGIDTSFITEEEYKIGSELSEINVISNSESIVNINKTEIVQWDENISWQQYMENVGLYAKDQGLNLVTDPFATLLSQTQKDKFISRVRQDYYAKKPNLDKYDYIIASFCGVAAGLIDVFFVGMPGESKLGSWTDKKVDDMVKKFAQSIWKSDKKNGLTNSKSAPDSIGSAIGYLERRFKVNYDARYASDLNLGDKVFNMSAKNHHLKSLGHSPDLMGLFFSILDQFTNKSSFISDGRIIRVEPVGSNFELKGKNFFAKLFCGFCNWIGHIMSDIAGSSGTRGHLKNGRGAGVPIPFFEMFQLCNFGSFNVNGEQKTLAELSVKVFEEGYDARHGATMAIPVAINEIMIRLLWAIKSHFYHGRSWKESIPFGDKPELRRMLLVGHGALCIVDGIDAGVRSGGNIVTFALRLNLVAWTRLAFAALKEIRIVYNQNSLDISSIDADLDREWKQLYKSSIKI